VDPASKLATARQLDAATSLGPLLELEMVSEQEPTGCSASSPASSAASHNAI
jgi:hypothetical protein